MQYCLRVAVSFSFYVVRGPEFSRTSLVSFHWTTSASSSNLFHCLSPFWQFCLHSFLRCAHSTLFFASGPSRRCFDILISDFVQSRNLFKRFYKFGTERFYKIFSKIFLIKIQALATSVVFLKNIPSNFQKMTYSNSLY